ncbi:MULTISPECIES: phage tail protein [unclassified Pseudoalteromonas]|uniref:phage tail protein n=1 Tax=unclassified Pseudoalteromonas TaxID=194690 RepID=UPI003014A71D
MATEPYIGSLSTFAGTFTIENWAMCLGQLYSIAQNQALFSLVGTTYGGDARTTFGIPDLRGRSPVGQGTMIGGQEYRQGIKQGREYVILSFSQLPTHDHPAQFVQTASQPASGSFKVATNTANIGTPDDSSYFGANPSPAFVKEGLGFNTVDIQGLDIQGGTISGNVVVGTAGSSAPVNIVNPVLPVNWLIALQGAYPPRS